MDVESLQPFRIVVLAAFVVGSMAGGAAIADSLLGDEGADADPDADALVTAVIEEEEPFESMRATREFELAPGANATAGSNASDGAEGSHIERTVDVWLDPPDREREEVRVDTGPTTTPGDVLVINGSVRQHYFSDDERLLYVDDNDWQVPRRGGFDRVDGFEATYLRIEDVDGRETYVVELRPDPDADDAAGAITLLVGEREFELAVDEADDGGETAESGDDAAPSGTTTWWIDAETGYPIKERVELSDPADPETRPRTLTTTYTNVTVDEPIPDDRFTFDPPPNTDVYEPIDSIEVDTVAEADEALPFAVPEPTVPERFAFGGVNANEFRDDLTAEFFYRTDPEADDPPEDVWIRVTERPPRHEQGDATVLDSGPDVGPFGGTLSETFLGTTYAWTCDDDGVTYEVSVDLVVPEDVEGDDAERSADRDHDEVALAFEIAASMGCQ